MPDRHGAIHESADDILVRFLAEPSEAESKRLLGHLIAQRATPLIRAVVCRRFRVPPWTAPPDAEDVCGAAVLHLVTRLEMMRRGHGSIRDFSAYVSSVADRAFDHYLRQKYPRRWRLKSRLRYLLSRHDDVALWPTPRGRWVCGFAGWREGSDRAPVPVPSPRGLNGSPRDPTGLMRSLFRSAGGPVDFDDLVGALADMWGVRDAPPHDADLDALADPRRPNPVADIDRRDYLRRLWGEILILPHRQRVALLLNLRDVTTPDVITAFPLSGIASVRQIGEALGLPAEEFAELWNALPLEDHAIARRLGLTRQQVINLRKAARARLSRRMRALEAPSGRPSRMPVSVAPEYR